MTMVTITLPTFVTNLVTTTSSEQDVQPAVNPEQQEKLSLCVSISLNIN